MKLGMNQKRALENRSMTDARSLSETDSISPFERITSVRWALLVYESTICAEMTFSVGRMSVTTAIMSSASSGGLPTDPMFSGAFV